MGQVTKQYFNMSKVINKRMSKNQAAAAIVATDEKAALELSVAFRKHSDCRVGAGEV